MTGQVRSPVPRRLLFGVVAVLVLVAAVQIGLISTRVLAPFGARPAAAVPAALPVGPPKPAPHPPLLQALQGLGSLAQPPIDRVTYGVLSVADKTYDVQTTVPVKLTIDMTQLSATSVLPGPPASVALPTPTATALQPQIVLLARPTTEPSVALQPIATFTPAGATAAAEFNNAVAQYRSSQLSTVLAQTNLSDAQCAVTYWARLTVQARAAAAGVPKLVVIPAAPC